MEVQFCYPLSIGDIPVGLSVTMDNKKIGIITKVVSDLSQLRLRVFADINSPEVGALLQSGVLKAIQFPHVELTVGRNSQDNNFSGDEATDD